MLLVFFTIKMVYAVVCVCVYVFVCACMVHVFTHVYISVRHICVHVTMCMHACVCVFARHCVRACVCVVCVCACVRTYMHFGIHVCM